MPKKRQETQEYIIKMVEEILPGGGNREAYEALFATMDDEQFDGWMRQLKEKSIRLCMIAPNQSEAAMTMENNFRVARMLGFNPFERVIMDSKGGSAPYLSKHPVPIFDFTVRRQAQLQIKKISIPENNNSVDNLSGQAVGASKGSKISYPELQIMSSLGLDNAITELVKYRGGDQMGFNAMNDALARTGQVRLGSIEHLASGVKSTNTLSTYLTSMHLENTLLKQQ